MRRPSGLRIVVNLVAVLLLVVVAGYAAYWLVVAQQLRGGLKAWAASERTAGYDIGWSGARVTGFPFRFRIALTNAAVARGRPALYRVTTPLVAGVAPPFDLSRWQIEARSGATATIQGINGTITARAIIGALRLGAANYHATLTARGVEGQGAKAGEINAHLILPREPPRSYHQTGLTAKVQLFHLVLPQAVRPLGKTVESVALDVTVQGGLPDGDWRQALTAWSNGGGDVEIPHAALEWGALKLEGNGTLALDPNLQPELAMTASIVNQGALIEAAVAAHMLNPGAAALVKTVLDLLAKRGPDGEMRITAPVTIQNQTLSIGTATLGKLPTIDWR
jgi:hypothetical protein